jgi:phosphoglycolate phosphatase-like HAD superfamily hydrolase
MKWLIQPGKNKDKAMHLLMFDIDGTLTESVDFDAECFKATVQDVLNITIDTNWETYRHATSWGILDEIIDRHNPSKDRDLIFAEVKKQFTERVSDYLTENDISPIQGVSNFLSYLMERKDVQLAIATGGWLESAQLKLKAAGIETNGIPMATSSDHFSRIEIMKIAESRCRNSQYQSKTYFGDGPWDLEASRVLGYNFVLVGSQLNYSPAIQDYTAIKDIMSYINSEPLF